MVVDDARVMLDGCCVLGLLLYGCRVRLRPATAAEKVGLTAGLLVAAPFVVLDVRARLAWEAAVCLKTLPERPTLLRSLRAGRAFRAPFSPMLMSMSEGSAVLARGSRMEADVFSSRRPVILFRGKFIEAGHEGVWAVELLILIAGAKNNAISALLDKTGWCVVGRDAQHSGKGKMRVVGRDMQGRDGVTGRAKISKNKLHGGQLGVCNDRREKVGCRGNWYLPNRVLRRKRGRFSPAVILATGLIGRNEVFVSGGQVVSMTEVAIGSCNSDSCGSWWGR